MIKERLKLQFLGVLVIIMLLQTVLSPLNVFAEDSLVDVSGLDEKDYSSFLSGIGMELDENKKYEYVDSELFNNAPQEMWNLAKTNSIKATARVKKDGKNTVRLHTTGEKAYPEIFFWNEKSLGGRSSNGKLFGKVDASAYLGIRIYVNKPAGDGHSKLSVMIGSMYTGYWSNSFYTYTFKLAKKGYSGYVYIPYTYFVNSAGVSFDPSSGVNFIAFKYPENAKKETDIYIGDLALFREATKNGADNTGSVSRGVGIDLKSDVDYMFWESLVFNNSTDDVWAKGKNNSFKVTTGITDKNCIPEDGKKSLKFTTTGEKSYPEIYFWNENYVNGRATNGLLFGSNIDINDYEGIRLWLKADSNNPYSTVSLALGKMYTGYWPNESDGFYEYTVIIHNGFEGYVNIPFNLFTNKKGNSLTVADFNFIAFKYNEAGAGEGVLYASDLCLYGVDNGSQNKKNPIGVQLDDNKKYEILSSKVFAAASQEMWNQSKINGITVTTGINDSEYIPEKGKTSVKISTTGEKQSPEIYYWNENAVKGRCTQGRFWGDVDNTFYDGIRLWIKIDENNTYSKLNIITGQMFTGYWPKEEVGFFTYTVVIPRGGFEGYINIPFSSFVNKKGEKLNAQFLNFIGFKYDESGFKNADFYISDLSLYRVAEKGTALSEDGKIIGGNKLPEKTDTKLPTKQDALGGFKPKEEVKTETNKNESSDNGFITVWIIAGLVILVALGVSIIFIVKRKNYNSKKEK